MKCRNLTCLGSGPGVVGFGTPQPGSFDSTLLHVSEAPYLRDSFPLLATPFHEMRSCAKLRPEVFFSLFRREDCNGIN